MGNTPNGILILIIIAVSIGLITGILSRSRAMSGIGIVILIAVLWPFFTSFATAFYKSLPLWVVIILSIIIISALIRGILTIFLGREAAGHFLGEVVFTLFMQPFRFIGYLFSLVRRQWR